MLFNTRKTSRINMRKWYAVYTKSRMEKRVHSLLLEKGIESFLPLQKTMKQWSDRKKKIEIPLFNGYVFVFLNYEKGYLSVLKTIGVVGFLKITTHPEAIREEQINLLKALYENNHIFEIKNENFKEGKQVKVSYGALKNISGKIIDILPNKILVQLDILENNYKLLIPSEYLTIES